MNGRTELFFDGVKVGEVQDLVIKAADPDVVDREIARLRQEFTRLPAPGTPAADLTDRDKLALALAVGVPCEVVPGSTPTMVKLVSRVPFAVLDQAAGPGYVLHYEEGGGVRTVGVKVKA